jgi:hypothetical protein
MHEEGYGKVKVIAINSSPNMGKGNTALVLDPFLEGMREAGAETLRAVRRELLPLETYVKVINRNFQQALDALQKVEP